MKMKFLFAALFAVAMSISGCTMPWTNSVATGDGLIIERFEPVIREKFSGDPIAFRVKLKNTGTEAAYDVEATIANIEEFSVYNEPVQFFSEIPSDTGNLGSSPEISWSWDLDAPKVPRGTKVTFKPTMKLTYTYKSETVKTITLVPITQLREYRSSGKALPSETISKSRSPISLEIEARGPIEYFDTKIAFPLSIIVTNGGGGSVCRDRCDDREKDMNMLDVYIHTDDVILNECDTYDIRMTGKTRTIVCNAEIDLQRYRGDEEQVLLTSLKTIRFDTVFTYTVTHSEEIYVSGR